VSNNLGYALTIEKLFGLTVTERAEWLRILMVELIRIANHLWALGFLLNDLGALQTPMLYNYIERELHRRLLRGSDRVAHDAQLHALRRRGL
jgi:NADH:ubiquinone oxidoreductase subunit D